MILMTFEIEHATPRKLTTQMVAAPPLCAPDHALAIALMLLRSRAFTRTRLIAMNQVHGWLTAQNLKDASVIEITVEDMESYARAMVTPA